jgi:hypothetical protein
MSILHVTNGDSARVLLERSGLAGTCIAWPDILHEGPTPLLDGEEWTKVRSRYLVSGGYAPPGEMVDGMLSGYRARTAALESYPDYDEVVFWFEHDLFDQLLLIRHLWWLGTRYAAGASGAPGATRFSLVCGQEYLGMLMPDEFPPLFAARTPITAAQIELGTRAWRAFTAEDPIGLLPFAVEQHAVLPYLADAIRRHLEEFPSSANGLARSERQILQVLSEGLRTPEEAFIEASRLEDHIFMGDASFWTIVGRLSGRPRPLVTAAVKPRERRLPSGTLAITTDGAEVLASRADHVTLNGIDRWLGGVRLTSERLWRWTGSTLRPSP